LTLGLLLPTALWVHLRVPKARAFIEFLTVLPYVIPPIALVAGIRVIKPHARWFLNSDLSLIPFYVVLALPFTFRALDAGIRAIDVKTLVDASRSLGAGWGTTLRRALVPNLRTAIISSAFLTATVVLGEFTIAQVLLKRTLPQFMGEYRNREPQGGMGLALLAIVATTALLAILTLVTRKRGQAQPISTF
jgi:putative spermidine/putrescine transport system permease protein